MAISPALPKIDFGRLLHAYGLATDTPGQLADLAGNDSARRGLALNHLFSAVIHQGTVYPVTPVVVGWAGQVLADPNWRAADAAGESPLLLARFLGCCFESAALSWSQVGEVRTPPSPTAAELAEFYQLLADPDTEDEAWDSPVLDPLMVSTIDQLRHVADDLVPVLLPLIADQDPGLALWSTFALAMAQSANHDQARLPEVESALRERLTATQDPEFRANLVLALGSLKADVAEFLTEPHKVVRLAAAYRTRSAPDSTSLLLDVLTSEDDPDSWFEATCPFFDGPVRWAVLNEVLSRHPTWPELMPVALRVIGSATGFSLYDDWGQILEAAFPETDEAGTVGGDSAAVGRIPDRLNQAQHALLTALADNQALWAPTDGNSSWTRRRLGLPDTRDELLTFLHRTTPDGPLA